MAEEQEEKPEKKKSRIKSLTIRFNKEVQPFQHVRIEATATITAKDDEKEVQAELEDFTVKTFRHIEHKVYGASLVLEDNVPY